MIIKKEFRLKIINYYPAGDNREILPDPRESPPLPHVLSNHLLTLLPIN
jgi:hypothetical protein